MNSSFPLYHHYRRCLSDAKLFNNIPSATLDEMLTSFRFETWKKGSQHDAKLALQRLTVIIEGRMELIRINPETGKSFTIMILSTGDVYDVLSLLDSKEHDVLPVALDDLKLLSVSVTTVHQWMQRYPTFNKNLMPHLSHCIRLREEIATDLALFDTPTRLARVILRYIPESLNTHVYENNEQDHQHEIKAELLHDLSNEQLAQLVGSVRQVVNRHLGQMKKEGLIHIDHHQIVVDDLQRLEQKAEMLQGHFEQQV
jgi:CRP/FNR family transcriptional regulator